MNDVLAPAEDTQQRASALNALGILSRLEETSPDRTGERKRWITALMHLARPGGRSSDDGAVDPEVLREVLIFLETLRGSSADSSALAAEPTADVPAEQSEQAQEGGPPFLEALSPPLPEEQAPKEMQPESALAQGDVAPLRDGYTQEEVDYVRTLQQQIHEREIARIQAAAQYPQPSQHMPPAVWGLEDQQLPDLPAAIPWKGPMPWAKENESQPNASVERVENTLPPLPTERVDPYKEWQYEPAPEEPPGHGRHARIEQKQGQQLFSTLARSLVLLGGFAFAALAYASNAALLPILGVAIVVGGALSHAWTTMLHTQDGGQSGRQRGERVSWLRAMRMCTLAVPVLTLIIGSMVLTLISSVLLPKRRADIVNGYARDALQMAHRLALHR